MKPDRTVPAEVLDSADRLAARLGISRNQVLELAMRLLEEREAAKVTEALNRVYARRRRDHGLEKMLALMQSASIARDEW